jgi:hypothetical protein
MTSGASTQSLLSNGSGALLVTAYPQRSMKCVFAILVCAVLIGCSPPPSKEAHVKQVQRAVISAGGEAEVLKESRVLFPRCSAKVWRMPGVGSEDACFQGLPGIQRLGDVFYYQSGCVRIRVHNSHQDTYFIYLLDPEQPQPVGFEPVSGNIGFIDDRFLEPDGSANRSQPVGPETNRRSPAAGPGG